MGTKGILDQTKPPQSHSRWLGRSDFAVEDEERDHVGGFGIDREHAPAAFVAYRLMCETLSLIHI